MHRTATLVLASCLALAGCAVDSGTPTNDDPNTSETSEDVTAGITYGQIGEKYGALPSNALTTYVWSGCYFENEEAGSSGSYVNITWPAMQTHVAAALLTSLKSHPDYPWEYFSCSNNLPAGKGGLGVSQVLCASYIPLSECIL